jgi:hypothetical protein
VKTLAAFVAVEAIGVYIASTSVEDAAGMVVLIGAAFAAIPVIWRAVVRPGRWLAAMHDVLIGDDDHPGLRAWQKGVDARLAQDKQDRAELAARHYADRERDAARMGVLEADLAEVKEDVASVKGDMGQLGKLAAVVRDEHVQDVVQLLRRADPDYPQ